MTIKAFDVKITELTREHFLWNYTAKEWQQVQSIEWDENLQRFVVKIGCRGKTTYTVQKGSIVRVKSLHNLSGKV